MEIPDVLHVPGQRWLQVMVSATNHFQPSHWVLFIPKVDDRDIGTRIDVEGDIRSGFGQAPKIERNYRLSTAHTRGKIVHISNMAEDVTVDSPGTMHDENAAPNPASLLETAIFSVPPPPPTLGQPIAEQRNCQWWVKTVVQTLVAQGICSPDAMDQFATVPVQHILSLPTWATPFKNQ